VYEINSVKLDLIKHDGSVSHCQDEDGLAALLDGGVSPAAVLMMERRD